MGVIEQSGEQVCSAISSIGIDCGFGLLTVTVGQLLLTALLAAVFAIIFRFTVFQTRSSRGYRAIPRVNFENNPANDEETLFLNPFDMARAMGLNFENWPTKTQLEKNINNKSSRKYYVVEIYEDDKRLVRKELRVKAKAYGLNEGDARLDSDTIEEIRTLNKSVDDDQFGGQGVYGSYSVQFRKVRWYDLGHWLTHPNRDIRMSIWVAIIVGCFEYSQQIFGLVRSAWRAVG